MKRKTNQQVAALTNRTTFRVRFSEIDSMQIVWHGEYVRYFEDGREAFGKQYGLDYMSIYREGYMVPIVDFNLVSSNNHYLLVKKRLSKRAILPVKQPR